MRKILLLLFLPILGGAGAPPAAADSASLPNLHFLVRLAGAPSAEERDRLRDAGLDLGLYAGDLSWLAAVPADRSADVLRLPEVRSAEPWTADRQIAPTVRAGRPGAPSHHPQMPGRIKLFVSLQHDVSLERGALAAAELGAIPLDPVSAVHGLSVWLPEERLADLAAREEVLWIGEEPADLEPLNDGVVVQTRAVALAGAPYGLSGEGTRVFVYDAGAVDDQHPTFDPGDGGRVKIIDSEAIADHPTHVAGTLAGDGSDDANGGSRGGGVAPAARLFSAGVVNAGGPNSVPFVSSLGDFEKDYQAAANDYHVDVANNSIGLPVSGFLESCVAQGDYGAYGRAIDNLVSGNDPEIHRPLILAWAVGNERGHPECGTAYSTIGPPACAKNVIGVGAIATDGGSMTAFSGWGPCDDGSLKPTLVSPGCETGAVSGEYGIYSSIVGGGYKADDGIEAWCGTSMAAPSVTGSIALLIEDWRKRGHGGDDERPLPALVRAMLAHTARDRGPAGPDYAYGYGMLDARALIDLERSDDGKLGNGDRPQWGTDQIALPSTVREYEILVPADLPALKATLAWDDPAPAELASETLVNDLTLELISPLGDSVRSWVLDPAKPELPAGRGANSVDTLEQAVAENPVQGLWTVRVSAASLPEGPQRFGLVYEWLPQIAEGCGSERSDFESGAGSWDLSGATIEADPTGGTNDALALGKGDEAALLVGLPSVMATATLRFRALVKTSESDGSNAYRDVLHAEIRDPASGKVLAVVDRRDSGWPPNAWIESQGIDLAPWLGGKVLVVFRETDDGDANASTFFVDDVEVETCLPSDFGPHFSVLGTAGQDGSVIEEGEEGNVGGLVQVASGPNGTIDVGDTATDAQVKGIVSFDTSGLPDDLEVGGVTLRVKLKSNLGANAQLALGQCKAEIHHKGGFSLSPTLEKGDFEASATASPPSVLGYSDPGEWSYADLFDPQPWNLTAPVDLKGVTQVRLFCEREDNDDQASNLARFWAGTAAAADRPQLILEYDPQ